MFETTKALVETPHHGDDGELDLVKDEIMDVLLKRDSQWWIGELKGKRGLFPANNVKEIKGIAVHMLWLLSNHSTSPLIVLPYTSIQLNLFTTSPLVVLPCTIIYSQTF